MKLAIPALLALAACTTTTQSSSTMNFVMQWDARPEAASWTTETVTDIAHSPLVDIIPTDIAAWCPAYEGADATQRAAFWTGVMSAIARYESTWNPKAKGGGGRYHGMMQILPATARSAGCDGNLMNGGDNLACAVKIASRKADEGRSVASVLGDWGPISHSDKRSNMAAWTRQQSYCQG